MSTSLARLIQRGLNGGLGWTHVLSVKDVNEVIDVMSSTTDDEKQAILDYASCMCRTGPSPCGTSTGGGGGGGGGGGDGTACAEEFIANHCSDDQIKAYETAVVVLTALLSLPAVMASTVLRRAVKAAIYAISALAIACESKTLTTDALKTICWFANIGMSLLNTMPALAPVMKMVASTVFTDAIVKELTDCCTKSGAATPGVDPKVKPAAFSTDDWLNQLTADLVASMIVV